VLAAVAVAVAAVVDARLVRHAPEVNRSVPNILSRGVPAELVVSAGAPVGRLRIRQPAPPDLDLDPREADGRLTSVVTALRRGAHELPQPAIRAVGPLGLGAVHHRAGPGGTVQVYPDMPAARRLALAVRHGRLREEGRRRRGPLGLGTEFESIRDYQPDDDIRQVNWRASARLGRPMSNQWRVEQDREVMCVVDAGRLMGAPIRGRTRLDAAVDVVAAIAAVADEIGDRCGVIVFDDRIRRHLRPTRNGGTAVVRSIFDIEPSSADSDYELAFRTIDSGKRAFVLVLTDLIELAAAQPLAEAMSIMARRHAVAVGTAQDPDIEEAVATDPADLTDLHRTTVALDMLRARTAAATAIRRAGAEVIETPVDKLSAACVAAYVRAKAKARL
jgi:uncharacterized protein (DUF58 family)